MSWEANYLRDLFFERIISGNISREVNYLRDLFLER